MKNAVVTTENFSCSQRTWTAASVQGRHGIRSRSDLAPTGTTASLRPLKRRKWGGAQGRPNGLSGEVNIKRSATGRTPENEARFLYYTSFPMVVSISLTFVMTGFQAGGSRCEWRK